VDVVIDILEGVVVFAGGVVAGCLTFLLIEAVVQLVGWIVRRIIRRFRRSPSPPVLRVVEREPVPASPPTPRCAHVLLVEVDEVREEFVATIELATNVGLPGGRLCLEVVDDDGSVRVCVEGDLPPHATLTRARFERSSPPAGATLADLLAWRWDVVVLDHGEELARWREHLTGPDRIDAEAEIMLAPSTPLPAPAWADANAPEDASFEGMVQLLRRAAALARVEATV
jgi:hypothetical protein